jgi:CheY-like chemotaxis protein
VSTVLPTEPAGTLAEIRVAVADDEETVVDVLRTLIGSDPTLRFVGAANDAEAAIDVALRERPDVILVDVRMPGGGGVRAVREITKRCPPTKIVALSAHEDANTVIGMISAGAHAYVRKAESTEKILQTIHRTVDRSPSLPAKPRLALIAPPLPRLGSPARSWTGRSRPSSIRSSTSGPGARSDSTFDRGSRPFLPAPTTPGAPMQKRQICSSTSSSRPSDRPLARFARSRPTSSSSSK